MSKIEVTIENEVTATKILKLLKYLQKMGSIGHSVNVNIMDEYECFFR